MMSRSAAAGDADRTRRTEDGGSGVVFGPEDLVMSPGTVGNPTPEVMAEACAAAGLAGVSIWGTYVADGTSPAELGARLRGAGVPVFTLEAAVSWCDGMATSRRRGRAKPSS